MDEHDDIVHRAWCVDYAVRTHKIGTSAETIIKTASKYHRFITNQSKAELVEINKGKKSEH